MPKEKKESAKDADAPKKVAKVSTGAWWKSASPKKKESASQEKPKTAGAENDPSLTQANEKPVEQPLDKKAAAGQLGNARNKRKGGARQRGKAPKRKKPEQLKETDEKKSVSSKNELLDDNDKTATSRKGPEDSNKKTGDSGKEELLGAEKKKVTARKEPAGKKGKVDAQVEPDSSNREEITEEEEPKSNENQPVLKLLVNAEEPEECRLALLADGRLDSIHVSTASSKQTKNNIYKGKIVAIEPSLQAAFVEYGTEKNGFLPFNEIHPEYYKQEISSENKKLIEQHRWKDLKIYEVLERGTEVLVQVVKEEVGNKGANMTTYLSIPGRCVVLLPGSDSSGISRKISGEERRSQLREIMGDLAIPDGVGWIVRTASLDINKTALVKDVRFLIKLWDDIRVKGQTLEGVGLVYQDHDCVLRFLREHFTPEIQEILVDDLSSYEKIKDFLSVLPTRQQGTRVRLHKGSRPIFNQFNVEDQIESIYQPQVSLPSGGSIVIDPTEALVAIDVNSGSTGKGKNFEDSIFKANMEAADELARQLRLRDLGGLIVVDFIDMRVKKNIREVEKQVKKAMKADRAKVDISRISKFGLMQISRQKLGAPIEKSNYRVCEHCKGRGVVRSVETLALFYLRRVQTGASRKNVASVECSFPLDVAQYLLNNKRNEISEIESRNRISIIITADPGLKPADHVILFNKEEKSKKE